MLLLFRGEKGVLCLSVSPSLSLFSALPVTLSSLISHEDEHLQGLFLPEHCSGRSNHCHDSRSSLFSAKKERLKPIKVVNGKLVESLLDVTQKSRKKMWFRRQETQVLLKKR
jgi:hypothetical protein